MAADNPPIKREMEQVFERIGILKQSARRAGRYDEKEFTQMFEDLVVACFLKHTLFWGSPDTICAERLNRYSRQFAGDGRLVFKGWMLTREFMENLQTPAWRLSVAP